MSALSLLSPRILAAAVTALAAECAGLSLIVAAGARKQKQLAGEARRANVAATTIRMAMMMRKTPSQPGLLLRVPGCFAAIGMRSVPA